jgi:hypothetical protein
MRAWAWILGGLIVWTIHFFGVYTLASLADVVATADALGWRLASLAFSGLCVLAALVLLAMALRRLKAAPETGPAFRDQLAAMGAGTAAIAIVWQALPNLTGY